MTTTGPTPCSVLSPDDAQLIADVATTLGRTTGWSRDAALDVVRALAEMVALAENGPDVLTPPATTVVTSLDALHRLPRGTVVRLRSELVADRLSAGLWAITGYRDPVPVMRSDLPAVVLHRPAAREDHHHA